MHKDPEGGRWMGVDVNDEGVDTYKRFVWEPAANKVNSIASATEAADATHGAQADPHLDVDVFDVHVAVNIDR